MGFSSEALKFAREAHKGQVDKYGESYILHVTRVGLQIEDDGIRAVAFLHDVLEDTNATREELEKEFGFVVAEEVERLTRKSGEEYFDYIDRVNTYVTASEIKIKDIQDNLRREVSKELTERYIKALEILLK